MPPKKNSAKADKKKEEAERKAREEAEAAEREERERLEREEQEQAKREESERQQAEEESRFLEETSRINELLDQQRQVLEDWKLKQWKDKQWEDYTSCRTLPDPSNEKAFNTYLILCEESVTDCKADIQESLSKIQGYLQLCCEVEALLRADGVPGPSEGDVVRYTNTIPRLHRLALSELDAVSLQYMQEAEKHVDTESYNMRVEASIQQGLVYSLWGNVVKNPRLKSFSFQDQLKLTLDIPKPLLLADAAVRVIQLPFDLLSPLSRSHQCKRSPPSTSVSTVSKSSKESDGAAPSNQEEGSEEPTEEAPQPQEQNAAPDVGPVESVDPDSKNEQVEQDQPADADDGSGAGSEAREGTEAGVAGDSCEPDESGNEGLEADDVNLRAFLPACGPIIFELLEMPPQPKSINNWTFRKVIPSQLSSYPYPAEVPRPPPTASEEELAAAPPPPTPGSSTWPPIVITMQLPDQFLFTEEPQLAQWDSEKCAWKTSGFKEVTFDLEEKTVSFQAFHFRPLALMVDRYINMPYLSWSMVPCGANHTLLTLEGGAVKITVQIKEQQSTLIGPTEVTALAHVLNKPMSACQLTQALCRAGANFFPALDADSHVSVTPKHHMVELSVYQSMALASCSVGFQWSRWNSEASRRDVVLRAVQTVLSTDSVDTIDQLEWATYIGGRRNFKVALSEDSSEFSKSVSEGCEPHPSLYSVLDHEATAQTRDRFKATSPMHCEAIKYWLTSVKILTFS